MYAFSEIADHMSILREFYAYSLDLSAAMVGLEACECLFAHLQNKKLVAEKFALRRCLAKQQALETQELKNVYWLPR